MRLMEGFCTKSRSKREQTGLVPQFCTKNHSKCNGKAVALRYKAYIKRSQAYSLPRNRSYHARNRTGFPDDIES